MTRPAERVAALYNRCGACEQWIKEGNGAIKWTRLSCRWLAADAVRLKLHALAYNLGNFMRRLAMPETACLASERQQNPLSFSRTKVIWGTSNHIPADNSMILLGGTCFSDPAAYAIL